MNTILTEDQKEHYFTELDNYFLKKEKKKTLEKKNILVCCENQLLFKDNTGLTCYKCGKIFIDNFEYVTPNVYLNQKFHNCTLINPSVKFKHIRRLHHFSSYNYLEVTMLKSFRDILNICNKMKLKKKIFEGAKIRYKEIFIDLRISSRSNIKKAMYIYCIYFSCNYYDYKIDIDELINTTNIEEKHYNKVLRKLEKKNIIYSNKKINKIINICSKNDLNIDKELLIKKYQELKKKNIKLNNNSILLGIVFELLEIDEKRFIKMFKTTKITLKKYQLVKYQ